LRCRGTGAHRGRRGELAGSEAFRQRRLQVSGRLDLAIAFEGLFRLEDGRDPLLRVHDLRLASGHRVWTLTTGQGPDVLLIHGLASTKSSFLDTAAILSRHYRVNAIDLPGSARRRSRRARPTARPGSPRPCARRSTHLASSARTSPAARSAGTPREARGTQPVRLGTHDTVIRPALRHHVVQWLPGAEQIVLDDSGHVPQVERPEEVSELLHRHFSTVDAPAKRSGRTKAA
jgi:pimeloyl-ACP methyl ester carboxylesterase